MERTLLFCLDYAAKEEEALPGIFTSVRTRFASLAKSGLPKLARGCYEFRNTYIAHAKAELTDREKAREALVLWVRTLLALHGAVEQQDAQQP